MKGKGSHGPIAIAASMLVGGLIAAPFVYLAVISVHSSSASCANSSVLHCAVFQQIGACSPKFWGVPWSVTIGGVTGVQPANTKLPLDNNSTSGTSNMNLSIIVFSLPDGNYHFKVSPSFFVPDSGSVMVNGTDVLVQLGFETSCTTTISPGP
jgi:hypothetical protein